uniref:Uncharacterized protein n=1 Tax=Arundo donax TaxID=35708 RepID=A0A0A9ATZ8_ARUDO
METNFTATFLYHFSTVRCLN